MTRKELFEAIKAVAYAQVPEVVSVGLWNRNLEYAGQEVPWATPAVFVEFGPIEWQPLKGGMYRGTGELTLHVVTEYMASDPLAAADLSERLCRAVELCTDHAVHLRSLTSHDHEELVETIEVFAVRFSRSVEQGGTE